MSWNNITPIWVLCNPFKIPYQPGYYFFPPGTHDHGDGKLRGDRQGPYPTYASALNNLLTAGGKQFGKEEWLE